MKLVTHFLGEQGEIFGRDENLLTNLEIDDISKTEDIIKKLEKYLDENEKINLLTGSNSEVNIYTIKIKKININRGYLRGEELNLNVKWEYGNENSNISETNS